MLSRLRKIGLTLSLLSAVTATGYAFGSNDTRTLSLKHVHTGETLTITYKKNGRYLPSAMARINYLMRDWRRNKVIAIDPRTIDLMWELYADLGSKQPIKIISGYRSPETNGMLSRIGRKVAKHSQHTAGKAIDLYFPDVPLARLRNSAIVREVGGVGYYPAGAGGFVHIDSGSVRYWPRPSDSQIAQIFRDFKSTIGARMRNPTMLAMREVNESGTLVATTAKPAKTATSLVASLFGTPAPEPEAPAPALPTPRAKPVLAAASASIPIPMPRAKPVQLAQTTPTITPVSAKPNGTDFDIKPAPRVELVTLAPAPQLAEIEQAADDAASNPQANQKAKTGLLAPVRVAPRVLTASLDTTTEELRVMLEKLQEQDERDDELQQASTKGGPVSNVMAKADRLTVGDAPSLRVQKLGLADPLFDPAQPLPFPSLQ